MDVVTWRQALNVSCSAGKMRKYVIKTIQKLKTPYVTLEGKAVDGSFIQRLLQKKTDGSLSP